MAHAQCPKCLGSVPERGFSSDLHGEGLRQRGTCPKCGAGLVRSMNERDLDARREWRGEDESSGVQPARD